MANSDYAQALLQLTSREGQVLALVAEGKTNAEIAKALHLSIRTVENHRYRICRKLDLQGKGALDRWIERVDILL